MLFDIPNKYLFAISNLECLQWTLDFTALSVYHQAHIISNQTPMSHFEFPIFHTQSSLPSIPKEASKLFTSLYPDSGECMLISLIWPSFIREESPCFSLFVLVEQYETVGLICCPDLVKSTNSQHV